MARKALMVWGGWAGHEPKQCADVFEPFLRKQGFDLEVADTLEVYADKEKMQSLSLIVPIWTMGELSNEQSAGLIEAVSKGVGIAGWHGGMCDSFRNNLNYQWMTGGQFVAHPDWKKEYEVNIIKTDDPIMQGIKDFKITSEQYYMLTDPGVEVLATTTFQSASVPWINGTVMPTVWKRKWNEGRVFYSALGHVAAEFEIPEVRTIMERGMMWAAR